MPLPLCVYAFILVCLCSRPPCLYNAFSILYIVFSCGVCFYIFMSFFLLCFLMIFCLLALYDCFLSLLLHSFTHAQISKHSHSHTYTCRRSSWKQSHYFRVCPEVGVWYVYILSPTYSALTEMSILLLLCLKIASYNNVRDFHKPLNFSFPISVVFYSFKFRAIFVYFTCPNKIHHT